MVKNSLVNYIKAARRVITNTYYSKRIYQPYFDKTQSIFIHIPKAAGTSIANTLYGSDPRHIPIYNFQDKDAEKFNSYFKFSFVRDPFTRIASAYFYCKKIVDELDDRHPVKFVQNYNDFEHFVLEGVNEAIREHYFLGLQVNYLLNHNMTLDSLDFIGKFENLYDDFNYVALKLGVDVKLGHYKKGQVKNYTELLTPKIEKKIKDIYIEDFRHLEY